MDSDTSETNILILTSRDRFKIFLKLCWRIIVIVMTPMIFLPVAVISEKNAYISFYVFLVTCVYWIADVLHPSVIALIPIAASSIMASMGQGFISEIYIRNELLDCLGVMMLIIAIEYSQIHRRVALKLLLIFGCSHYRLSFLLFSLSMFLSMWITDVVACGLMMPIVKAILIELEKMGISEIYQVIGKAKQHSSRHEQNVPRPTDFTLFYFLGVAYSSSIGGMATIMGSQTNQIFKVYCEQIFPASPKIEFPHFILLNLPGVLVMETLLYLWMNFYFLRMFRSQNGLGLEISLSEEETQFVNALLKTQYLQLGRIKSQEIIVGVLALVAGVLQATISVYFIDSKEYSQVHSRFRVSSPCFLCVVLLFILPVNLNFLELFRRADNGPRRKPLPNSRARSCLNWALIKSNLHWDVLFIIGNYSFCSYTFADNAFKNYYYADNDDDDQPSDEEGTLAYKVKKAIAKRSNCIDDFFEKPKKKKKVAKKSSSVGRSSSGGVSYITSNKDDIADASHLIKIEIYDVKKIKNIAPMEHWKHAEVRVKYYAEADEDKNLQSVRDIIFNITKHLATKEDCVKYFIDTDK